MDSIAQEKVFFFFFIHQKYQKQFLVFCFVLLLLRWKKRETKCHLQLGHTPSLAHAGYWLLLQLLLLSQHRKQMQKQK